MLNQKAAPTLSVTRQSKKQSCTSIVLQDWSQKQYRSSEIPNKEKHYPHSDRSINLSKHCPYCGYHTGLIIIRFKDDKGFCRCGKCDAALFSLNDESQKQGLQHIGEILDSYLPSGEAAQ